MYELTRVIPDSIDDKIKDNIKLIGEGTITSSLIFGAHLHIKNPKTDKVFNKYRTDFMTDDNFIEYIREILTNENQFIQNPQHTKTDYIFFIKHKLKGTFYEDISHS